MSEEAFKSWAILELFGHRRLAGFVQEVEIAGKGMLRIDIPKNETEILTTQFYSPDSMYGLTPVSEEIARELAKRIDAAPVQSYELPRLQPPDHLNEEPLAEYESCPNCHKGDLVLQLEEGGDDEILLCRDCGLKVPQAG